MMKNIFSKFLTSKKNRKRLSMSDSNEFGGIISKSSPIAIVDEPVTFTSTVDFTDATINGLTSGWSLDGNTGTDPNVNFIGTTDNKILKFKTNNTDVATLPSNVFGSTVIGKNSSADGTNNVVIGNETNRFNNGIQNVVLGNRIQNITGNTSNASHNVIAGYEAASKNRSSYNLLAGYNVARSITRDANNNVILGSFAGITTGNPVDIIPTLGTIQINSGDTNWNKINETTWETTGVVAEGVRTNTYVSYNFLEPITYRTTLNVTINAGTVTLNRLDFNTFGIVGMGFRTTSGEIINNFLQTGNFYIQVVTSADFSGSFTLNTITTSIDKINDSVIIGGSARPGDNNTINEIVIGHSAEGKGSNTVQIGNTSITNTYLQGNLQLPAYGDGTITGTPTKALAVDTDGKVLEVPYNNAQVYVALLSQAGTAAPTAVVLENSIGNVTYTRDSAGVYNVVLPSTITNGISRIYATIQTNTTTKYLIVSDMPATDVSTFQIECTGEALSDDFTRAKFEIRIYP